jgi:uncharacterized protein YecE (DUF72 family)
MRAVPAAAVSQAPADPAELAALRQVLPPMVQFGTCGWVFPGWEGLVWSEARTEADLERDGLVEYAAHPLLTTVYIEPGPDVETSAHKLRRYAAQLPPSMHCVLQVHPALTTPRFTRAGEQVLGPAGQVNPHFLDSRFFLTEVLPGYQDAFGDRLGPFLLVFPPELGRAGISADAFSARLERFLAALPAEVACAIEPREPALLTPAYARLLALYGTSHVFTTWPGMPPLLEQAKAVPTSPEVMIHLVDPTGKGRERRERLAPFSTLRAVDPRIREQVVALMKANLGIPTYVLVHNEAEGSAPLTIVALARLLAQTLCRSGAPPRPTPPTQP